MKGEISITSDTQMTPPYGRKQRGTKEPLNEGERGPNISWQIDGETMEIVRLYFLGLQNHCRW